MPKPRCEGCGNPKARPILRTVPVPVASFALDTKLLYAEKEMTLCFSCVKTYRKNFKAYAGKRELVEQRKPKVKA